MSKIITIAVAFILVILFAVTPVLVYCNVVIRDLDREWIGFWGSYVGSLLGVIATLIALAYSFFQNKEQHVVTQTMLHEQMRIQVMPALDVTSKEIHSQISANSSFYFIDLAGLSGNTRIQEHTSVESSNKASLEIYKRRNKEKYYVTHLQIKNAGQGSLSNLAVRFGTVTSPFIGMTMGECVNLYAIFDTENTESRYTLSFIYNDVLGNRYRQRMVFTWNADTKKLVRTFISPPEKVGEFNPSDTTPPQTHPPAAAAPEPTESAHP